METLGGITDVPLGSQNSLEFEDLARFAVQDYNQKHVGSVVEGYIYYITLEATKGGNKKVYETKIWVKKWENFKEVQEFKLVGDYSPNTGGIIDVPCPNSLKFEDLARFAVQNYNKKCNDSVKNYFSSISSI